jgi:hypothetical protein
MNEELATQNLDIRDKILERNKLQNKLKKDRKEVENLKLRLSTIGVTDQLKNLKDQYRQVVDKNYTFYEEVRTSQKENSRLTKEVEELISADPEFESRLKKLKSDIDDEK